MSFGKLLAVGRSFMGGKDTPCRFRMTTQNLLPDFGDRSVSWARTGSEESAPPFATGEALPTAARRILQPEFEQVRPAADSCQPVPLMPVADAPEACAPSPLPPAAAAKSSPRSKERGRRAGFFRPPWMRNPFRAAAAARPDPEALVQGELGLEHVKVVRNDLSDSDLELRPRAAAGTAADAPALGAASDGGRDSLMGSVWRQAMTRFLSRSEAG